MPCNIEIKARPRNMQEARRVAERVATETLPDQNQVDTYFNCDTGRLKLREIRGDHAALISYSREDRSGAKPSYYQLLRIKEPDRLKEMLASTIGVLTIVEKRRQIVMHRTVRIHLDQVVGLGDFIEFEAVLADGQSEEEGHGLVEQLRREFSLRDGDLVAGSYSDMLLVDSR